MWNMFFDCKRLSKLDLSNFNTSKVQRMDEMFSGCSSIEELDLSSFSFSSVEEIKEMFMDCTSLENIVFPKEPNTITCINISGVFQNCKSLKSICLHNFDIYDTTDMSYMFSGCSSIKELDLSHFYNAGYIKTECMFAGCDQLSKLDIRNLDLNDLSVSSMLMDCALNEEDIYPLNILEKAKKEIEDIYGILINDTSIKSFVELVFREYLEQ